MSRAEANWERLVRAALRGERLAGTYGHPVTGIAGNVPSCLRNNVHIEEVLRAADEIQDEDPTVARILCEHAYTLAQNLDPNSEGRGVLQFKTGLMSVIRQKLAKREGGAIDRSGDIAKLQEFYKLYREKHKVDELIEDEMKLRESAVFSGNLGELERKTLKRKKVLATLKVLWSVIEDMTKDISPEDAKNLISEEMKKVMQKDAERTEDVVPYNIIPLDALSSTTNAIVTFPEVRAAISILQYHRDLPRLPGTFSVPDARNSDMLDLLQYVFGFQEGNVKNQREHIVHLLANEQSRVGKPSGNEPKIDGGAVDAVFNKALDNYIKWCSYLPYHLIWTNTDSLTKEKKLLYVCLYYLMWGEAANVRFLPEGLCYIFHHVSLHFLRCYLAGELEDILRKQTAEPAESCSSNGSVSFLENVISPLYDIIAAEAANNKNGRAPHSAWRNYDDFNEFFWSLKCFQLGWPWKLENQFFSKPSKKDKGLLDRNHHYGKTSFVEHRTFLHLYHSFHRLWMFLIMMFQMSLEKKVPEILLLLKENNYVGRGMHESPLDYVKYVAFWIVILGAKFSFTYFLQIKPLVKPTRTIISFRGLQYAWHDFVSKNNHNAITILSLWAPVVSIRSVEAVHRFFEKFPRAFMDKLHVAIPKRQQLLSSGQDAELDKFDAPRFAPFWNEIVRNLREEDYISNAELELLLMPKNDGILRIVQWPLFLLASKVFVAKDIAADFKDPQEELWSRISKDEYMQYAVVEVEKIYGGIHESISKNNIQKDLHFKNMHIVIAKLVAVLGILRSTTESSDLKKGAVNAIQDLYEVVHHEVFSIDISGCLDDWDQINRARAEGRLFNNLKWPNDPGLKNLIKRLYSLLTIKESAANVPKNLEARRRLQFFTNSLFMRMPVARPVSEMFSFSVFTPYYSEIVLYSMAELQKKNEDGITTLFYLQKIYPDEWKNFLTRINRDENAADSELFGNPSDILELRLWASYRGQTLARTVRGMMYYRKALMLQSYLERMQSEDLESTFALAGSADTHFELSPEARAQADLKFTYVVTCQIYGKQKGEGKPEAADIALLMQRNEALRVAYIDEVESVKNGKPSTEYFSKLVKADIHGKDKEIYSIKLPGNPKLGEGKPENQNHAIIFTRGNAVQTIDMNQDNYFEEALKMRNLLEEFSLKRGKHHPSILGVREHVFTGSVSSLASFMSNQETSFVTLGQRVLANPLKVRMHYGHPDVFDRIFHITRGGISKASRSINISEDIYAGFNSTLRQGSITHHEYIQVGKGRDVGLNQIAVFEGKVAGGNGEQVLSRDIYRLGQLFDFFRMLSFYVTTVGFYFCTMLTVLTVYIFLYGKTYLFAICFYQALSGVGESIQNRADILQNTALNAALNTQFLFQIGVFTAVPMILGFILESGVLSYRATGRGFVVRHIKFAENYRLYSRSHFVKGMEVAFLLVIFLAYGFNNGGAVGYILLSISSWFMALSWLFAPYLFNPSGFEWQKIVEDFRDWTNWLFYRGGIGVKGEESWEAWWEEELQHIYTIRGRILETILSLRFFIFQYGVVYHMNASNGSTALLVFVNSLALQVYWISWAVLGGLLVLLLVFGLNPKAMVHFQLFLRLVKSIALLMVLAGLIMAVVFTKLSIYDVFASILAFVPTGWGILSIAVAWKPIVKKLGLWKTIRSLARLYDAGMGMIIFVPIAICSWFPFISTFQTRLLFNQAFSRGLEISLILAGNNPNAGM
nr:unnamed protein product [Digitaria exilis]